MKRTLCGVWLALACLLGTCHGRNWRHSRKVLSEPRQYQMTPQDLLRKLDLMEDIDDLSSGCGVPLQQFEFGTTQPIRLTMADEVLAGSPLAVLSIDGDMVPTEGFRTLSATIGKGKASVRLKYTARGQGLVEEYTIQSEDMLLRLTAEPGQPHLCLTAIRQ